MANDQNWWVETLGISGLVVAVVSTIMSVIGKRYLDRRLAGEKATHNSDLKSLEGTINESLEVHKQKLRNSEFVFQMQYRAVLEIYQIKKAMIPERDHPEMDWEDALFKMASNAEATKAELETYLHKYFAVLTPTVVEKLERATVSCQEAIFEGPEFPGTQFIDDAFKRIEESTSALKSEFDGQRQVKFEHFSDAHAQQGHAADARSSRG